MTEAGSWTARRLPVGESHVQSTVPLLRRYYSFTVTEALEAWFRLSSSQGKYLYLLEGDGTGGRKIAGTSTTSTTAALAEWEVLQPGHLHDRGDDALRGPGGGFLVEHRFDAAVAPGGVCDVVGHADGGVDHDPGGFVGPRRRLPVGASHVQPADPLLRPEGVVAGVEAGLLAGRAMHRPAGVVAVHEPAWVVIDPAVSVPNDVTQLSGGVSGIESMLNEKSPSRAAWCVVTSIV